VQGVAAAARLDSASDCIDYGVSLAVKNHTRKFRYPRWINASPVVQTTIEAHLRHLFPLATFTNASDLKGLGNPHRCLWHRDTFDRDRATVPSSRVLAIDLSRAFSAMPKKNARARVENVEICAGRYSQPFIDRPRFVVLGQLELAHNGRAVGWMRVHALRFFVRGLKGRLYSRRAAGHYCCRLLSS